MRTQALGVTSKKCLARKNKGRGVGAVVSNTALDPEWVRFLDALEALVRYALAVSLPNPNHEDERLPLPLRYSSV